MKFLILLIMFFAQEILLTFIFALLRAQIWLLLIVLQVRIMAKVWIADAQVSRIGSNTGRALLAATLGVPRVLLADRFLGDPRDVEAIRLGRLGALVFLRIGGFCIVLSLSGPIFGAALNSALIEFTVVYVIAIIFGCKVKV